MVCVKAMLQASTRFLRFLTLFVPLSLSSYSVEEVILLKPTGPYSVGTKSIELHDPFRTMLRDSSQRRWMVQAYYPSQPHDVLFPYMPGTIERGLVQGTTVYAHAQLNSSPLPKLKCPLIIFIPGLGEERQKYTILSEELASHGYVVLSLDEPYVSNYVKFSDDTTIVLAAKDTWKVSRDREYRYRYYDEAMAAAIQDIEYMLRHLDEIDETLTNSLDRNHIILMGHSFGGNVAHTLGFKDKRIAAVVDIDSKITERKIFGRVGVPPNPHRKPILFIRGMMQYQEDVGDQLTKIDQATIWSPQVKHSAFSDQAYLGAKIKRFGQDEFWASTINWFFKKGPHWAKIDTDVGEYEVDEWFKEYRKTVIEWLKKNRQMKDSNDF